ncbi:hypothetical protein [Tenacibaculum halocynthiae]|uniref:hypothetical protein n=1 Tax=Tenacibaculum halocynthiae TaxID=1254437 RepID=UPI003D65DD3D
MLFKTTTYRIQFFIVTLLFFFQTVNAQYSYEEVILIDKNIKLNEKRADSILSLTTVKDTLYAQTAHSISYFFYKKN